MANDAFIKPGNPGLSGLVNRENALDQTHLNDGTRAVLPDGNAIPGINAPLTQVNPYIADVTRTDQARKGLIDINPTRRTEQGVFSKGELGPLPEMYQYGGSTPGNLPGPYGTGTAQKMLGFQTAIWASLESVDPLIEKKVMMLPRFWHDRIPRGVFELHNGLVKQRRFFRGSIYKTIGLDEWEAIDPVPTLSNDPCRFPKHSSVDYAWDQLAWSGFRRAWGSHPICANAFRYIADAAEQIAVELEAGMEQGVRIQETFNRDFYVLQSVNFGRSYVMSHLTHGQPDAPRYFFDPFVKFDTVGSKALKTAQKDLVTGKDGHPHAFVVIDARVEIEPVNWTSLDRIHEMLKLRCPDAAIGSEDGEPVFGLMINNDDVVKSVEATEHMYREWLEAKPQSLIDDYKLKFKTFRYWGIVSDPTQLRFKIVRSIADYTDTECEKYGGVGSEIAGQGVPVYIAIAVEPQVADKKRKGINGGDIPVENIDYVDAELAIAPVFMNNVFVNEFETQGQVNLKNGMTFGAFPALNGQWGWIRGPQTDADPFQQTGKFYGLFLLHPRPEARVYDTMSFIYRRCKESIRARCPVENPRYNPDAVNIGKDATLKDAVTKRPDGKTIGASETDTEGPIAVGEIFEIALDKGYGPLAVGDVRYLDGKKVVVVDTTSAPWFMVANASGSAITASIAKGSVLSAAGSDPGSGSDSGSDAASSGTAA